MIEQRDIGWSRTSASTALLQYEIDTPMIELARQRGMPHAGSALAYGACAQAILDAQILCNTLGRHDFKCRVRACARHLKSWRRLRRNR
ncbi:FAD dependent oxidoreductase [Xanthomonas fragariae]|uniref:FAD dependent oxidoreductase n=1 Tax=Xanthomonas fragariae TaxID=48664 RepID=A0A1Y6H960_9XANT|nr:FAD dependent oxidoreductase [Xanthomonas fragariae]SMQ99696.1 hypothetical protein PD885_02464 [Xanthomonas fragariae]SMR03718.1 FAD dependent oxidoreductase [Xanthomonas fragariae]